MRYIKETKKTKVIKIEKTAFKVNGNTILNKYFGIFNCNEVVPNIDSDCSIIFKNNRYYFLIPIKTICINNYPKEENTIALDGGLRTFLTGYSNSETIEICNNLQNKIIPIYKQLDSIQSKYDNQEINNKRGIEKRQRKISNLINELHWKSINYLIEEYDNILLGNISTKNIVSNEKKKIGSLNKRVALSMRLFIFKERLKYKCTLNKKKFIEVNESYTSKTCSSCGNIKKEQNKTKIYKCEKCKCCIDRDYNGAKNIYILGTKY